MESPRIFVSYCHEDVDGSLMKALLHWLTEGSPKKFDILVDIDLSAGDSLGDFMNLLDSVDAVVLVLGPAYKRKALERKDGVYREFSQIINKYMALKDDLRHRLSNESDIVNFMLFPLMVSGTHDASIPKEIEELKYANLTQFRFQEQEGKLQIPRDVSSRYKEDRKRIQGKIDLIRTRKTKAYKANYDKLYNRLFLDTKSDWLNRDKFDPNRNEDPLFVKTIAYKKAEMERAPFFIGRKGSGKSSITEMLWLRKKSEYKAHVNILAECLNISQQYYTFSNFRMASETAELFPRDRCLELIWELFIYLACIQELMQLAEEGKLSQFPSEANILRSTLKKIQGSNYLSDDPEESYNGFLMFSTERLQEFIDHSIQSAREDQAAFAYDLGRSLSSSEFLNYSLGNLAIDSFDRIIKKCTRKFLLTFDGFDDVFDGFRRESLRHTSNEELQNRTSFELAWLQALVRLTLKIWAPKSRKSDFFKLLHPCITVPKDRFLDLIHALRDSYRLHDTFQIVNWSGIELAILLRKRLEELTGQEVEKQSAKAEETLQMAFLHEHLEGVPWHVDFEYHEQRYQMPLFLYVLRHSFWRPREILMYYAEIISLVDFYSKKGSSLPFYIVKQQIKDRTHGIINSEFINEFKASLVNIEDIVECFREKEIRFSYEQVNYCLDKVDFEFALGNKESSLPEKIKYLYQIGFIGVFSTFEMRDRLGTTATELFYFSEGYRPLRNLDAKALSKLEFLVHPVFCEYLSLDTSKEELLCQYTWEYLHQMEARLLTSQFEFEREGMGD